MTRRPIFWIAFTVLGLSGAVTALRLFTVALPTVSLEIDMDREAAIAEAAMLSERYQWGPADARSAASFGQVDSEAQTYVELEGGGRGAFQDLVDEGAFPPYQWRVRRFVQGEVQESLVRFSPAGEPLGFRLQLAEDDPGAGNLPEQDARAVAERGVADWSVDLAAYDLIESSEEARPGGRVDHTFVYERTDLTVADARFRLRLVVSGNRLSELTHFVFVPEAFSRQYADMRSTNDAIALVSQSFFILVYVLLGAGLGTALLLRERWIEWRTALAWGALIAVLFGLNTLNALPLAWMGYDTALSANTFVLQSIAAAGAIALLGAPILAFFFFAGESLGRRAFPEHLQQWRFWAPDVARSKTALGMTVTAYLLVGLQVGYVVLFYMGTSRLEGWWSPADALVQPDLLATYQPWLQAVSTSLFASFWEESIFRAVPIAGAALVGARFGKRNAWIWAAVLVQAVVFAAGHANYPQQPAYARVVELTFPALGWGIVYVYFGLVPTILAHFLYNLALISSVLFASEALFDQGVIVLVAAVPLAVVLWARRGGRGTDRPPEWAFNRAWSPTAVVVAEPDPSARATTEAGSGHLGASPVGEGPDVAATSPARPVVPAALTPALGLIGMVLWAASILMSDAQPRLEPTRSEAIAIATGELERRGFDVDGWTASARASDGRSAAHDYVFDEVGAEAFSELMGTFLAPPQWVVRFVDWDAEPAQRVEEFIVNVEADASIRRVVHTLPESAPGARLGQEDARALARAAIPPGNWEEVGAEETTHDTRTDWDFTYRERTVLSGVAGEARAAVTVQGDEVTNVRRFVQIPEEWEREQREVESRRSIVSLGLLFTLVLMYGAAAVVAIVVWSRRELETAPLWKASAVMLLTMSLTMVNGWPATAAGFSTAQPFNFQAGGAAVGLVILSVVAALGVGLVVALGHSWSDVAGRARAPAWLGVSIGALVTGVSGFAVAVAGGIPAAADYGGASTYLPFLADAIGAAAPFLFVTSALLALAVAHRRFAGRPALRSVTAFAILALGFVIVPGPLQQTVLLWAVAGLVGAAAIRGLVHVIATWPGVAPAVFATMAVLQLLESARVRPYPGSMVGGVVAVIVLSALAWAWVRELSRPSLETRDRHGRDRSIV